MDFTIGADIEMMLERNGKLVSAVPILGEKGVDLPYGHLFFDNVLAEFTVEPANNREAFVHNVLGNIEAAKKVLSERGTDIRIASSARYPKSELESDVAKLFGCSPDYCAYELRMNEVAEAADETDLRTAGGHVHFSHEIFTDPFITVEMIKMMDLHLGIPSLMYDDTPEGLERRTLYGAAGAHRPKDYPGGEYRSLSNFWMKHENLIAWVHDATSRSLQDVIEKKTASDYGYDADEIRAIINENRTEDARKIFNEMQ